MIGRSPGIPQLALSRFPMLDASDATTGLKAGFVWAETDH
jgi:hypothetical protein